MGIIHVVPLEDLYPHALTPKCACQPTAENIEDTKVLQVIHNAFDGRDFDERDMEVRNKIIELNKKED